MDGALRRAFTGGGAPISPTEMLEKLKGRPGQLRIIIFLLELAEAYYPEGTQVDTRDGRIFVQRKFMDKVAAKMKGLGFEPYTFDPVHGAQPYNGLDL